MVAGGAGDHLHGGVHHGDVHKDLGPGLHVAQGKLHEESLELHGLLCCYLGVSCYRQLLFDIAVETKLD